MLEARFEKYILDFYIEAKTSRNTLKQKESWFIYISDQQSPDIVGIGEAALLKTLSHDDRPGYEAKLNEVCANIVDYAHDFHIALKDWPSIRFGLETAFLDLMAKGSRVLFPSSFTQGNQAININGLVWMGEKSFMFEQIKTKIAAGYTTIKLKVGAIDFEEEISLVKYIRQHFSPNDITIRLDANGAFTLNNSMEKLKRFSEFHIHSIEQPIRQGQWEAMSKVCESSPIDIALDEELIGIHDQENKRELLEVIRPHYIILKPCLVGGFRASEEWISQAEALGIEWWATSALESNIGLNAIAQWTHLQDNPMPQGLGTGQLYQNNINSPLFIKKGHLHFDPEKSWNLSALNL